MVSIRRRKLLGWCLGINCSGFCANKIVRDNSNNNDESVVHPVPLNEGTRSSNGSENAIAIEKFKNNDESIGIKPMHLPLAQRRQEYMELSQQVSNDEVDRTSTNFSSGLSEEDNIKKHPEAPEVRIKGSCWRRRSESGKRCNLKGVYFKNQKWQAAIKVDKIQHHLGTVGTQEEAARLYDRGAFLQGRQTNFELEENEKQILLQLKWKGFLSLTRSIISKNKSRRVPGSSMANELLNALMHESHGHVQGSSDSTPLNLHWVWQNPSDNPSSTKKRKAAALDGTDN